jgi:3-hydroxyisobutyrate dehydrogenase-like beta-hydroxyacid dehydrogenase
MDRPNGDQLVGYIGLGSAGYPMAAHLARSGFKLLVQDANPDAPRRFSQEFRDSLIANSSESFRNHDIDVVVTMLPDGNTVREVLFGEQGVAKWLQEGNQRSHAGIFGHVRYGNQ